MSISITPAVVTPQTQAPVPLAQLLVAGATVEARVLQQISTTLVRMVIAATAVDVASPVQLPIGARLRLAVSQGEGGLQLTVLSSTPPPSQSSSTQSTAAPPSPQAAPSPAGAPQSSVTQAALQGVVLKPVAIESASAPPPQPAAPASPADIALTQAAQQAAPRQGGLSPLFADLGVALASGKLPPGVLQAAVSLMALRPQLGEQLSGPEIRAGLQRSGLFLESSLGNGRPPTPYAPDLKAALVVFRQVLSQWLGDAPKPAPQLGAQPMPAPTSAAVLPAAIDAPPLAFVEEIVIPRTPAGMPARQPHEMLTQSQTQATPRQLAQPMLNTVLTFVQEIEQNMRDALAHPASLRPTGLTDTQGRAAPPPAPATLASPAHGPVTPVPPPPYRGADPAPQAIASPTLVPEDAPVAIGHRLLEETDAAVARQTLFQIASLPESSVQQGQRSEHPRWAFEIPFATPQGTAVAQFEIERDGRKDGAVEGEGRVWRARFSLDIEPAGPVHAVISLVGGHTSVRLWAERADTAARLRDGVPLLSHALREAALEPGDITIGGAPPPAPPPGAGHFWDRAS